MIRQRCALTADQVRDVADAFTDTVPALQVAVYVMCGGGLLGRTAAEHPVIFSIDDRVGRLPYARKDIYQAVMVLAELATAHGLDPHDLPPMPRFHGCGVF